MNVFRFISLLSLFIASTFNTWSSTTIDQGILDLSTVLNEENSIVQMKGEVDYFLGDISKEEFISEPNGRLRIPGFGLYQVIIIYRIILMVLFHLK